jgi:methylaspartate ammonia-lyase
MAALRVELRRIGADVEIVADEWCTLRDVRDSLPPRPLT